MLMLPHALSALFLIELIARAKGQTTCAPLMQALVQQAEATNSYGSWDACCARTGLDCLLSRQAVPPGYEPCDAAHSARAGCNRLAQGTVCMIGGDGLVSGSPCGASIIRSCGSVIALGGRVAVPFNVPPSNLGATPASILASGVLDSQLCCSTSACTFASPCTSSYNMSACISDGVNFICIPLDQPDDSTYAAQIVQDGHNCVVASGTHSSTPTSTTPQGGGSVPTPLGGGGVPTQAVVNKGGGNAAIIGGSVGGAVALVFIAVLFIFLCLRIRRRRASNGPSNEWTDHQGAAAVTSQASFFPGPASPRNAPGYTPSFPSYPSPQWTSTIGNLPSFPGTSHQNRNTFEFPANPQNSSQVYQDPRTSIIPRPSQQNQNMFEFPANQTNPSQFYQDPRPSIITRPAFRPPASPPPPFRATELPTSAVDTQAMEARIAALESRIVALSAPSTGVQVGGPETGVASEMDGADPPRMDGAEPPQYDDKE